MNWNEQVKLLNNSINQITSEIGNFDKHTDIFNFVKKFNKTGSNRHVDFVKITSNSGQYTDDYNVDNNIDKLTNIPIKEKIIAGEKKSKESI